MKIQMNYILLSAFSILKTLYEKDAQCLSLIFIVAFVKRRFEVTIQFCKQRLSLAIVKIKVYSELIFLLSHIMT